MGVQARLIFISHNMTTLHHNQFPEIKFWLPKQKEEALYLIQHDVINSLPHCLYLEQAVWLVSFFRRFLLHTWDIVELKKELVISAEKNIL